MKILIAVNDEDSSRLLCDYVLEHLWRPNCSALILHAVEPFSYKPTKGSLGDGRMPHNEGEQKAEAQKLVQDAGARLRLAIKENEVHEKIEFLPAKDAILTEARQYGADLIVVGTRGLTGFTKFIVGSVSAAIVAEAPCSVFLVRPKAPSKATASARAEHKSNSQ